MLTSMQITLVIKDEPLRDLLSLLDDDNNVIDILNKGLFIYHRIVNENNKDKTIKDFLKEINWEVMYYEILEVEEK